VLVLMGEPAFAGCLVAVRLVGVIEAEQTENKRTKRNDRLIAVAVSSQADREVRSLDQLGKTLPDQIEHFFVSYNVMEGKQFKPVGRFGPDRAESLVEEGEQKFRDQGGAKGEKAEGKKQSGSRKG
jgi:inorganic pyrophosphatase